MKKHGVGLLAVSLIWAFAAQAEDARVLPKGRSRFSAIFGQTAGISQTFNNDGRPESLTKQYNIPLDSTNLGKFDPELKVLVQLLNDTKQRFDPALCNTAVKCLTDDPTKPLVGDALARGFLDVGADANVRQYNFMYQYGISDKLSIGLMVPYVRTEVRVAHALAGQNTAALFYNAFGGSMGTKINEGLNRLRSLNVETFQNILVEKGYNRFGDYEGSGIGDVVIGGRFNYMNAQTRSGQWLNSFQVGVTVPSGKISHPRDITAQDFGKGIWDVGPAHIVNYSPKPWLMLSHGLHYTARFKGSRVKWVRNNPDDFAPDQSTEENVDMWLGDKFWTNFGAQINVTKAVSFESNYEWYWKAKDRYQGSRNKDYGYLSDLTDSFTGTLSAGLSISTIPAFFKKDFPAPLNVNLNYYWPVSGRNSVIAPYGTAELALYF